MNWFRHRRKQRKTQAKRSSSLESVITQPLPPPVPPGTITTPLGISSKLVSPPQATAVQASPVSVGSELYCPRIGVALQVRQALSKPVWAAPYRFYEATCENNAVPFSTLWVWEAQTPDTIALLQHEGEVLTSVSHSGFPAVLDAFPNRGCYYLITEPLSVPSLAEMFRETAPSVEELFRTLQRVAEALEHLHQRGWIHCAVRPEAILLSDPPKVVDFRWAVRVRESLPPDSDLPLPLPSDFRLAPQKADARVDVYCLGVLLAAWLRTWSDSETTAPIGGLLQLLRLTYTPQVESLLPDMSVLSHEFERLSRRYQSIPRYEVVGMSTVGLERSTNQDSFGYLQGELMSEYSPTRWIAAVVADGMGGMQGGELASRVAVSSFLQSAAVKMTAETCSAEVIASTLVDWCSRASEDVHTIMKRHHLRGGTTLLGCLIVGNLLAIGHVGDCRFYRIADGRCELLTRDHSVAMLELMRENITAYQEASEEARHHPARNQLYRALGESPLSPSDFDTLATTTGTPAIGLKHGDTLLLCSDGVWEPVSQAEIAQVVVESPTLSEAARKILSLVLQRGAPDNATLIIVRIYIESSPEIGDKLTQ